MAKYGGTILTHKIKKYHDSPEGFPEKYFNNRTMMKKALKAFLSGKRYYKYKGELFAIPVLSNKDGKESRPNDQVSGDTSERKNKT